jgi:hypothetical protein
MNETLTEAINTLGRLQFETGGTLLKHIVSLKGELLVERQRRIEVLREAGMTDVQVGEHADVHRLAEHSVYAL